MKYKLSKAAGEQFYSTFKPITEKLEDVAEPITRLQELSEEQSERMLPPPVVPAAIAYEEEEDDDDEFEEAESAPKEGYDKEEIRLKLNRSIDKKVLDIYDFKQLSYYIGKPVDEISNTIKEVGAKKRLITLRLKHTKEDELKEELNNRYKILNIYNTRLDLMRKGELETLTGKGVTSRLYKMNQ